MMRTEKLRAEWMEDEKACYGWWVDTLPGVWVSESRNRDGSMTDAVCIVISQDDGRVKAISMDDIRVLVDGVSGRG